MRLPIDVTGDIATPGATGALYAIRDQLKKIVALLDAAGPRRASLVIAGLHEIPRREGKTMFEAGNHFFDQVGIRIQLAPNGDIDGPPRWSCDNTAVQLVTGADGLSCDVFADEACEYTVTATADADNPVTAELEQITFQVHGTFSHSKATSLGGTVTEIPRT